MVWPWILLVQRCLGRFLLSAASGYLKIENLHEVGKPPPWLLTDKPWDNPKVTDKPVPVTVRIPPLDPLSHGAAYFNAVERSPHHGGLLDGLRDYYR